MGADWQTYTLHLNSNALGTGDHRVFLDFGHDTGLFEVDEISLVAGHVGSETLHLPVTDNSGGTELLTDGTFDVDQTASAQVTMVPVADGGTTVTTGVTITDAPVTISAPLSL